MKMKIFAVVMDRSGNGFQYLKDKFGKIKTDGKLKAGIFASLEICKIMRDDTFRSKVYTLELAAWDSLVLVVQNFLESHRVGNCAELVSCISATQLLNVTQNAFLALSSGFFPFKFGSCE